MKDIRVVGIAVFGALAFAACAATPRRGSLLYATGKKLIVLLAVISGVIGTAVYADVDFPTAGDGGGDLATAGATSSDVVTIKKSGTYTASENVTFKSIVADGGGTQASPANMVFDFTANNAKVSLAGGSSVYGLSYAGSYRSVTLKGGIWDFGAAKFLNGTTGDDNGVGVTLTDGVVVTNVSSFYWGDHAKSGCVCSIADGAKVYTTGDMLTYATGADAQLNISGGAKVTVGGSFKTDDQGNAGATTGNNSVTVTGEGTALELKGATHYFGNKHQCNTVTVTDKARLVATSGTVYIGKETTTSNNTFIVSGDASASLNNVNVGAASGSVGNRCIVENGAYATNTTVTVGANGSCRNELVVSNAAAFVTGKLICGDAGASGNAVRVYGTGCDISVPSPYDLFGVASDGLVEFNDGATFDARSDYLRFGRLTTNCTLRIASGSNLFVTNNTCSIGAQNCASLSNRMEVVGGSYAKVVRLRLLAEAGCVVLSNSTFEATDRDGFVVGWKDGADTQPVADNRFEMQGDHPKATTPGQFLLKNKSTLHLQIPATGYDCGYVLIESKTFTIEDADSRLTVDMERYYNKHGGRVLVAKTTDGVTLNAGALAASNALLPEGCSFSKSADGNELYLNVPRRSGMVIVVR
jgi:hypothetical protein